MTTPTTRQDTVAKVVHTRTPPFGPPPAALVKKVPTHPKFTLPERHVPQPILISDGDLDLDPSYHVGAAGLGLTTQRYLSGRVSVTCALITLVLRSFPARNDTKRIYLAPKRCVDPAVGQIYRPDGSWDRSCAFVSDTTDASNAAWAVARACGPIPGRACAERARRHAHKCQSGQSRG